MPATRELDLGGRFCEAKADDAPTLSAVLDSTWNGIVAIDRDGRITVWNQAAEHLLGVAAVEAIGRHVSEVIPGSKLPEVLETGVPHRGEKVVLNGITLITNRTPIIKNGKTVGAVAVFQNISDLEKQAQELEAVKELNAELNTIIESIADGVIVADGDGIITRVNRGYECIAGVKASEYIGKHVRQLIEEGYISDSVTLKVLETHKPCHLLQTVRAGKDLLNSATPVFNSQGKLVRIVTIIRDVSELYELQAQLDSERAKTKWAREELRRLRKDNLEKNIVVYSEEMKGVFAIAERVAATDATVLIVGESGTGKEIVARWIHEASTRSLGPFVKINCAAIPESLLETELFGYEGGAFTGAHKAGKPGLLEIANGGTFFFDEVSSMPLGMQAKLLRVLQEREFFRVGGRSPIALDVRFIFASNRDLERMVNRGEFRRDLYYRINVFPLEIPPLRSRPADILPLTMFFLKQFNAKYGQCKRMTPEVVELLKGYQWPGNVRELQNVLERLVVGCSEVVITPDVFEKYSGIKLKSSWCEAGTRERRGEKKGQVWHKTLKDILEETERQVIEEAYNSCLSTRKAAKLLGVNQSTVVKKMKKYNIRCQLE